MDLNLIRTFLVVFESQSLTVAASRLHISQPAASQALSRMRRELDDPLFTRSGRDMLPSPLAESLYPVFHGAIAEIDRAVDSARDFDPTHTDQHFRIALSELGEVAYLPDLLRVLTEAAPRARVEVLPLDVAQLPEWLSNGHVDVAITSSPVPGPYERVTLKFQRYSVVMAEGHELAVGTFSFQNYLAAEHLIVSGDSGRHVIESALRRAGGERCASHILNHYASVPRILSSSSLISTVPDNIAAGWTSTWPLVYRALPFEAPPAEVRLFTRAASHRASALRWFRDVVFDALSSNTTSRNTGR